MKTTTATLHDGSTVPMTESVYRQADHNVYSFVMEMYTKYPQRLGRREEAWIDYAIRSDALMKLVSSNEDRSFRTMIFCLMVKQRDAWFLADVSFDPEVPFWIIAAESFFENYMRKIVTPSTHRILREQDKAITKFARWYVPLFNRAVILSQHIVDKTNGVLIAPKSTPEKQNVNFALSVNLIKKWTEKWLAKKETTI